MACQKVCKQGRMMHEVTYWQSAIPIHLFHTTVWQYPWELNLLPSMQLLILCISTLITMTSLQFTQAWGMGYARGMYGVPLSIPTCDSTLHGFTLVPRPLFLLPHGLGARLIQSSSICIASVIYRYVYLVGSYKIATKYIAFVHYHTEKDVGIALCHTWPLLSCIIPTLFAYFLACHPYIFLLFFSISCFYTSLYKYRVGCDTTQTCSIFTDNFCKCSQG